MTRSERILGLIAAAIAIFAFVTGIQSLKQFTVTTTGGGGDGSTRAVNAERSHDDSPQPAIPLTTFRSLPRFIVGCSSLFSETKGQFMAKEYIYADDTNTQAVIFVNGEPIMLKRVYRQPPADYLSEFTDGEYTTVVTIQKNMPAQGEAEAIVGILTIRRKDGISRTIAIYGEIAC
jgi:hypothetical protein